jgi:hypothetical protein
MARLTVSKRRPRAVSWLSLCGVALVVAASCSKQKDTQDYVPSQRGAIQPDAGGALVDEATACQTLTTAEANARKDLSCPAVARTCPDYIRPAGGADCFQYEQVSLDGCVDLFGSFTTCEDFARHPCLISAVSKCDSAGGEAGAGGSGGAPSTEPSDAGSAGTASEAGAGGV